MDDQKSPDMMGVEIDRKEFINRCFNNDKQNLQQLFNREINHINKDNGVATDDSYVEPYSLQKSHKNQAWSYEVNAQQFSYKTDLGSFSSRSSQNGEEKIFKKNCENKTRQQIFECLPAGQVVEDKNLFVDESRSRDTNEQNGNVYNLNEKGNKQSKELEKLYKNQQNHKETQNFTKLNGISLKNQISQKRTVNQPKNQKSMNPKLKQNTQIKANQNTKKSQQSQSDANKKPSYKKGNDLQFRKIPSQLFQSYEQFKLTAIQGNKNKKQQSSDQLNSPLKLKDKSNKNIEMNKNIQNKKGQEKIKNSTSSQIDSTKKDDYDEELFVSLPIFQGDCEIKIDSDDYNESKFIIFKNLIVFQGIKKYQIKDVRKIKLIEKQSDNILIKISINNHENDKIDTVILHILHQNQQQYFKLSFKFFSQILLRKILLMNLSINQLNQKKQSPSKTTLNSPSTSPLNLPLAKIQRSQLAQYSCQNSQISYQSQLYKKTGFFNNWQKKHICLSPLLGMKIYQLSQSSSKQKPIIQITKTSQIWTRFELIYGYLIIKMWQNKIQKIQIGVPLQQTQLDLWISQKFIMERKINQFVQNGMNDDETLLSEFFQEVVVFIFYIVFIFCVSFLHYLLQIFSTFQSTVKQYFRSISTNFLPLQINFLQNLTQYYNHLKTNFFIFYYIIIILLQKMDIVFDYLQNNKERLKPLGIFALTMLGLYGITTILKTQNDQQQQQQPHRGGKRPAGIMNQGNTCFVNSLLQALASAQTFKSNIQDLLKIHVASDQNEQLIIELNKVIKKINNNSQNISVMDLLDIVSRTQQNLINFQQQDTYELYSAIEIVQPVEIDVGSLIRQGIELFDWVYKIYNIMYSMQKHSTYLLQLYQKMTIKNHSFYELSLQIQPNFITSIKSALIWFERKQKIQSYACTFCSVKNHLQKLQRIKIKLNGHKYQKELLEVTQKLIRYLKKNSFQDMDLKEINQALEVQVTEYSNIFNKIGSDTFRNQIFSLIKPVQRQIYKQTKITKYPKFLVIHFKQLIINPYTGQPNYMRKPIQFSPILQIKKKTHSKIYKLTSLLTHIGNQQMGHYFTFRKSTKQSDQWFLISDTHTEKVSQEKMKRSIPYMMFYQLDQECYGEDTVAKSMRQQQQAEQKIRQTKISQAENFTCKLENRLSQQIITGDQVQTNTNDDQNKKITKQQQIKNQMVKQQPQV